MNFLLSRRYGFLELLKSGQFSVCGSTIFVHHCRRNLNKCEDNLFKFVLNSKEDSNYTIHCGHNWIANFLDRQKNDNVKTANRYGK